MKKYPKYKPSGVEWIGDVPEHWEVKSLKHLVDRKKYYQIGDGDHGSIKPEMYQEDGIPYIRVQNLTWNGEIDYTGLVYISKEIQDQNAKSKLFPHDILIAKTGATIGKLGIIPEEIVEANTTSSVAKISVDKLKYNTRFILYSFMSKSFQVQIWLDASQKSAQPGFNVEDLVDYKLSLPPLPEQTAIAAYLDRKTAQIDQSIAEKERLIELFREERQAIINHAVTKGIRPGAKMKPSGVEWIGDVPEGWAVKRLKYVASIFGRIGFRGYTVNDIVEEGKGVITLSPGNIKSDILTLESAAYLSFEKYYESPEIMIFPKDIVLVKTGSTIGKTAIIPENVPEMTLNPQLVVLKELRVFPKFLYYQTTCPFFKNMFEVEQTGGTTPTISQEKINSFPVIVPPTLAEQKEITAYIDQKTVQIDTAISGIRQEIALLQEYRQALIFEAVTGKIDVRENSKIEMI